MAGPPRLDEQRFIERVARLAAAARSRGAVRPVLGIGDDAAVLAAPPGLEILLTTDFLVEGTHFRTAWTPGFLLGRKAIAVNLSDIAAMGGVPHACVLSVGFPRRTPPAYADAVARGVADGARRTGVALVGGDTCASPVLFVSLTLLGVVEPGGAVRRGTARPGDGLYVTGRLGASAAGLELLRRGAPPAARAGRFRAAARALVRAHRDPVPRLVAGRALGVSRAATAMMDLSDGLRIDLPRLCAASRAGAVIEEAALPLSPQAVRLFGAARARRFALVGGEDYELLFAARDADAPALGRLAARLRLPITRIGQVVTRRQGVRLLTRQGRYLPFAAIGGAFEHFPRRGLRGE